MIILTITYACDVCGKTKILTKKVETIEDVYIEDIEEFSNTDFLAEYYLWNGHWQESIWKDKYVCQECHLKSDVNWEQKIKNEKK